MVRKSILRLCLVCGLLLVSIGLMLHSMRGDAGTCDEFGHLMSGYGFLRQLDLHGVFWDPIGAREEQPPLIKSIAALPLLFMKVELPQKSLSETAPLATNYFYNSENDPDRLLFWARVAMLLLFVLLALLIERWARQLYGAPAGLFALGLALFNTTIMAYGRYVMTDVGIALFYALSIYTFLCCLERPSIVHTIIAGITFGLAQVAKFSALALFPTFLAITVVYFFRGPENAAVERKQQAARLLKTLAVIWLIGGVVILGVYTFETWNLSRESQAGINQELLGNLRITWPADIVGKIIGVSQPVGNYVLGLAVLSWHNARGHLSYLFGHIAKSQGWPYFPVAFLLKTQLPLIIFICLAAFLTDKAKTSFQSRMLLLSALLYLFVSLLSRIDIGVRHLLPIYPLLIIWASQAVYWPFRQHSMDVSKTIIMTGLACWYLFGVVTVHPHYLAYFNELAGGPENGYRYLSDSNVDMGQDIKRLGAYLDAVGVKNVTVLCSAKSSSLWACKTVKHYIPSAKPWDPNLPSSSLNRLPTGFFVVGKTPRWLTGAALKGDPEALSHWKEVEKNLESVEPLATVGYSIDLYYLTKNGPDRPTNG
jgi:Dolichyl-phosphate-mannose-protein mannosyltransferase